MLPPVPGAGDKVKDLPLFPVGLGNLDVEADRNRNVVAPSQEPHANDRRVHVWGDQFNLGTDRKHDNTLNALAEWLPSLRDKGLVLVPITTIVRQRNGG